ncbi:MAG TPA: DUF4337 family protein [Candidatus Limnocylindria bacterium]|jgi:hypothetical protein|nr:DUF4337 family protein [Candidatus Limnocylindria bacterium]
MKIQIPDSLKEDAPKNNWGKILTATPIIMTVISTMLAGLASSEMTRAQYSRSSGAQQQAKAGDQWGYFQAKRLRGAMQRSTLDLLQATVALHPADTSTLGSLPAGTLAAIQKGELLPLPPEVTLEPAIKSALEMLEAAKPDEEIAVPLNTIELKTLVDAERATRERADTYDVLMKPISKAIDEIEQSLANAGQERLRDFTAVRLRYTSNRYDAEARLNQGIAELIELEVRKSNLIAERHRRRSQRFFFGMLGAQMAVIVSTFSLAARARSMLWTFAAAAGLSAVGFAVYVFFYV